MYADLERIQRCGVDVVDVVVNEWFESGQFLAVAKVELAEPRVAGALAVGDLVEFLLDGGGELVVDEGREVVLQEAHDGEGRPGGNEGLAFLPHVPAVDDGAEDRGVGGGATDAFFLELLHERRFGVASRRGGAVGDRLERFDRHGIADLQLGKERFFFFFGGIVVGLLVGLAVAGESDRRSTRRKFTVGWGRARGDGTHLQGQGGAGRVGHLGGKRALPDQSIQGKLVRAKFIRELIRAAQRQRRANGLVGFLGVLHLRLVFAGFARQVWLSVGRANLVAHRTEGLGTERDGVGAHVGDVAGLVETLCEAHDFARRDAQLVAALLLQRARHERCLRRLAVGLFLDAAHGQLGSGESRAQLLGAGLVNDDDAFFGLAVLAEVLARGNAHAVDGNERGGELGLG